MLTCPPDELTCERPACAPALDDPDAGTWFIAFTKSNRHYDFVTLAGRASIEFYIPMAERIRTVAGGKRCVSTYPLFGPYLFFRGNQYTPAEALGTLMLRAVIPVVDQAKIRNDLANLDRALSSKNGRRVERCDVAIVGKRVRVSSGALEGLYGTVAGRRGNSDLLLIQVEGMMGGAIMEIDAGKLEAAE